MWRMVLSTDICWNTGRWWEEEKKSCIQHKRQPEWLWEVRPSWHFVTATIFPVAEARTPFRWFLMHFQLLTHFHHLALHLKLLAGMSMFCIFALIRKFACIYKQGRLHKACSIFKWRYVSYFLTLSLNAQIETTLLVISFTKPVYIYVCLSVLAGWRKSSVSNDDMLFCTPYGLHKPQDKH